ALSQDPQNLNLQSDIVCLKIQILKMTFYKIENSEVENQEPILQVIQAEIKTLKDRYQAIQALLHS
ncbi:MAG: hypothetical protein HYY62_04835, partial [Deltaproteobacteria bacterium]|nr:hypothetical protein [Deltaproteobacteria bacterium]